MNVFYLPWLLRGPQSSVWLRLTVKMVLSKHGSVFEVWDLVRDISITGSQYPPFPSFNSLSMR